MLLLIAISGAVELRSSKRRETQARGGGKSISVVFGRMVRAGGVPGTGENHLRLQN
jgi:hypothetical protein